MTAINNNRPVDMKQMWQQMEPAPFASSALSAMTVVEDRNDRFIYYLVGATFLRYDTFGNTWQRLASPILTPTVFASLRYNRNEGNSGRVISCPTTTSLRIAGLNAGIFENRRIKITRGTGIGQVRTISTCPEPVKYDQGLATAASGSMLGDSTKRWRFNQWSGFQCRITFNTGVTQIRKILYNDATTLTFADGNYQPIDPWNNSAFSPAPVITAGLQAHFVIEATDITMSSPWSVNPDHTSRYVIESGGIFLLTSAVATPFYSMQYYDIASDVWQNKTASANLILAAFGTDGVLERTGGVGRVHDSGIAESGTAYVLTDTHKAWVVDMYKNYYVRIVGGTGTGQLRRIICNRATELEVNRRWDITPDATTAYEIVADRDELYFGGNAQAMLYQYDADSDLPIQGLKTDFGIANNMAARLVGLENVPIAIASGVRNTGGITAVNQTPTAGGSGYIVGDILTAVGGTNGRVMVEATSPGGVVTQISLLRPGAGYTVGTGIATTGGAGTGCTIAINTVGVVCFITTAINHNFKIGDVVTLSGDLAYAGNVTIIGCDALTTFDIATAAIGSMVASNVNSPTVIVDSTKNWIVNEHVGKIIQTHLGGIAGAMTPRVVVSNTATAITVATITTALVNGTGRYIITEQSAFGRDEQYRDLMRGATGHATGGSTTTLVDSTKRWSTNQWAGYRIRVIAGIGRDRFFTITSNTATTLTYSTQDFTPTATTHYVIFDSFGTCTTTGTTSTLVDTAKNWIPNQWAGKRVRIIAGAGHGLAAGLNEMTIVSNTATVLTLSAAVTGLVPDTTTVYTILGIPIRGAGIGLLWAYGGVSNGRHLYFIRGGGSNTFDCYNIVREVWEYGFLIQPQMDVFGTGSYYVYDGNDRIYISPGVGTGVVQYIYYFDIRASRVLGLGSAPNTQGTPVLGNRMEIVSSPAGINYLYHMRHSATEMYRVQIFF